MANFHSRSADASRFSMVPRTEVPRSSYRAEQTHKTTFDSGYLIPIYLDEILPGDTFRLNMTAFCRLSTPIVPIMDNLYLDTFFFFVPNRLVWDNWVRLMGEQQSPSDNTNYNVPVIPSPTGGYQANSLGDYLGLPTAGQIPAGNTITTQSLPFRAYNLIYNEWFRDQNLATPITVPTGDGPDTLITFGLHRRGKRHDYFTSCLPWPEKPYPGGTAQGFAYQGGAPVKGLGTVTNAPTATNWNAYETGQASPTAFARFKDMTDPGNKTIMRLDAFGSPDVRVTIADMRQAFQVQRLLERDARGGTRYAEVVRSHFGVVSPDARLQRPEYLGGGSTPINISPIAQTSATGVTGGTTPLGALAAVGTGLAQGHRASGAFTEHGIIIGLANVRADLTYQQGYHRMWNRRTRFDYYWPAFAHLGEQAVYRREIYATGVQADDVTVFGYQERWAEYRHKPNRITGLFRSTHATPIDMWHLAQKFTTPPVLGQPFIEENPPVDRILAIGSGAAGKQFLFDGLFSVTMTRCIPAYSVPGLADHF